MTRDECKVCYGVGRGTIVSSSQFLRWHELGGMEDCPAYLPQLRLMLWWRHEGTSIV